MSAAWDAEYRWWFVFQLPEALSFVPAKDPSDARERIRRSSYPGAPIEKWPIVRAVWTCRNMLSPKLLAGDTLSSPGFHFAPNEPTT